MIDCGDVQPEILIPSTTSLYISEPYNLSLSISEPDNHVIDYGDVQPETIIRDDPVRGIKNPRSVGTANKKVSYVKNQRKCCPVPTLYHLQMG